jgi:hypothetical protein
MGASLLVFKNKSDVAGCMSSEEIGKVRGSLASRGGVPMFTLASTMLTRSTHAGLAARHDSHAQVEHYGVQCIDWIKPSGGPQMGSARCQGPALFVLRRRGQRDWKLL